MESHGWNQSRRGRWILSALRLESPVHHSSTGTVQTTTNSPEIPQNSVGERDVPTRSVGRAGLSWGAPPGKIHPSSLPVRAPLEPVSFPFRSDGEPRQVGRSSSEGMGPGQPNHSQGFNRHVRGDATCRYLGKPPRVVPGIGGGAWSSRTLG
eukprot:scaffold824_cov327-Pavlova_lutheri.AAC.20